MASSSSNVVGVHYRVGKKIGEGSFGVIFEGTNLLNNQQVAIKFVSIQDARVTSRGLHVSRNQERAMLHSSEMNTGPTRFWSAAVSPNLIFNAEPPGHLTLLDSRDTECLLFWSGRIAQYPRN